jgi:hypothetical protein
VKGAYTGALKDKEGLLEACKNGALLLNDLDAAPKEVLGALLSILNTKKGEAANFSRLGDQEENQRSTKAWLLFSTNKDIAQLVAEEKFREDFIFRLEDRVIFVPPLRQRPADIPALSYHIWNAVWGNDEQKNERSPAVRTRSSALSPPVIEWMLLQPTNWIGNVRALRALLLLAASMAKLPTRTEDPLQEILREIMARGPEYPDWVGILGTGEFIESPFRRPKSSSEPAQPTGAAPGTGERTPARPEKVDLDATLLEELKSATSPKWSWLMEENENAISDLLRNEYVSAAGYHGLDQLADLQGDNPRRIHLYKLLLYLALQNAHMGHSSDFEKILGLEWTQTSKVVQRLQDLGLVAKGGKDGRAERFVLAPRPSKVDLNATLLERLKNATSPEWAWLSEREDGEAILKVLQEEHVLDRSCFDRMLSWLASRQDQGEANAPASIHIHKLLLYLGLQDDHGGRREDLAKIIVLGPHETSEVLEKLCQHGLLAEAGKDRFVLRPEEPGTAGKPDAGAG